MDMMDAYYLFGEICRIKGMVRAAEESKNEHGYNANSCYAILELVKKVATDAIDKVKEGKR